MYGYIYNFRASLVEGIRKHNMTRLRDFRGDRILKSFVLEISIRDAFVACTMSIATVGIHVILLAAVVSRGGRDKAVRRAFCLTDYRNRATGTAQLCFRAREWEESIVKTVS